MSKETISRCGNCNRPYKDDEECKNEICMRNGVWSMAKYDICHLCFEAAKKALEERRGEKFESNL